MADDFESMTKAKLLEYAAGLGVDGVSGRDNKAAIIQAARGVLNAGR